MPEPWINVDVIPQPGRPDAVTRALAEAVELRDRLRAAQEELAGAQAELERQQQADVAQAAQRVRSGSSPGSPPAAIAKARDKVELAKRNANALGIASDAAQHDLVEAMREHADAWLAALDEAAEKARRRGREAIEQFESATREVGSAAAATGWLRSALDDGRFDRRLSVAAGVAPSSKRKTANSEPLRVDELLAYARELIDPPAPTPARAPGFAQPATFDAA